MQIMHRKPPLVTRTQVVRGAMAGLAAQAWYLIARPTSMNSNLHSALSSSQFLA
jgi:hypothetical protein